MTLLEKIDIILSSTPIEEWSSNEIADIAKCEQNSVAAVINRLSYEVERVRVKRTIYYRKAS